jgi:hypothetical protein
LLHGHIHPYGENRPEYRLGGTRVRNVVGYHLLELRQEISAEAT